MNRDKRPFGRRAIALTATYAIALSGVIAGFGAASAAVETAGQPASVIICHAAAAEQGSAAPSSDETDGKNCIDCCLGCLTSTAALPSLAASAGLLQTSTRAIALPEMIGLFGGCETKAHRCRGPPPGA